VSDPKRFFPDPTFQVIPDPDLGLDPDPFPGQTQFFKEDNLNLILQLLKNGTPVPVLFSRSFEVIEHLLPGN